ncbi:MAG: hypothetical protein HQK51_13255 [Oligoflexia bacterium]|nr:hypothetical protein [Oligoflexia bacterium]
MKKQNLPIQNLMQNSTQDPKKKSSLTEHASSISNNHTIQSNSIDYITTLNSEQYIFFLKDNDKFLPEWFFQFATSFLLYSINIIPVTWSQFLEFSKKKNLSYLIIATTNFNSKNFFTSLMKSSLERSILYKKIYLFHISSFNENNRYPHLKHSKFYKYFVPPLDLDFLVENISVNYLQHKNEKELWPGGKRVRPHNL